MLTKITFGKYKGLSIEDLIQKDVDYAMWACNNVKRPEIFYLEKMLNNHKIQNTKTCMITNIVGNLTDRVTYIVNNCDIEYILKLCDLPCSVHDSQMLTLGLTSDVITCFTQLHRICPSVFGCYIDYLLRHFVSKTNNIQFKDTRTIITLASSYDIDKDVSQEINKFWYNWKNSIIENAYESCCSNNSTSECLIEIYQVSLAHSFFFRQFQNTSKIIQLQEALHNNIQTIHIFLEQISNQLSGSVFKINPILGNLGIPADCDMVIDNIITEIKVTNQSNDIRDFCQLIGYTVLHRSLYDDDIDFIQVINPLLNTRTIWNIKDWSYEGCAMFLKYLGAKFT